MNDTKSQKVAFLIEMFQDLDSNFIENLVDKNTNSTLESLVSQCLTKNEDDNHDDNNQNDQFVEMISLIPASTTSYFQENKNEDDNNNNNQENKDNNDLLNGISKNYHSFFENYLNNKDISKLIDIYTHLCLMNEQYKMQYDNNQHSNYNKIKLNEYFSCILMINTLMKNINKSPNIDKYRRIRESNKSFQKKIANIQGSKLLLKLCGWDYIKNNNNDNIYIFNSKISLESIQSISNFIQFYVEQEIQQKEKMNVDDNNGPNDDIPIITDFPRKKLKPKNQKMGKKRRNLPNINKLSNEQLREKRMKNLGNINDKNYGMINSENKNIIGPIADGIMDLNAPNLRNELRQIGQKKHKKWLNSRKARKRIFTLRDIEQLRKEEFDQKAKGPKTNNELDEIGKQALKLTNEFRKSNNLPPCKWHQSLCDIGKVHSKNMSEGKVPFGHHGFNDRVKQYPFRPLSAAENVAMSNGLRNVASVAVNGWIESPGHRKNLLSNNNYCGIGVYRGYNGAYYLTQLFGLTNF